MSDQTDKLKATLDQLHAQLEEVATELDEGLKSRLKEAIGEIETVLDQESEEKPTATLSKRMKEATSQFEQSHPTIAGTLERLADVLAQMGI